MTDQLVKHFPEVINVKFTAEMETHLDEVEEGKMEWVGLLRNFYKPFAESVALAKEEMENALNHQYLTGRTPAPQIGAPRLYRVGLRWDGPVR